MSFFKKHLLSHIKTAASGGLNLALSKERRGWHKADKSMRQKLGLTGKRIKRMMGRSSLASPVATSATTEGYHHIPRTLSQLTGGV